MGTCGQGARWPPRCQLQGQHPWWQKPQGQAEPPERVGMPPPDPDTGQARSPGRTRCVPPPRATAAPAARAALPGTAKPPRAAGASPAAICPCRCSRAAAALKPNAARAQAVRGSPLPGGAFRRGLAPRTPDTGMAPPQPPARASLHVTRTAAGTRTVLRPPRAMATG